MILFAQTQTLPFQHLTLGPGQDVNMVYEIIQDRKGFMWFGTFDGLVRYDGHRFKHYPYNPETNHPMKSKGLRSLFESNSGNIWMVSGQMVLSYHPDQDSFYHIKDLGGKPQIGNVSSKYNEVFLQDSLGNLWLRSLRGVFRIREKQDTSFEVRHYHYEPGNAFSLRSDTVHAILYDNRHRLWLGTQNGLHFYDPQNDRMVQPGSKCNASVISLCETATGKIGMGTQNNGLYVYDPDTDTFSNYFPETNNAYSIAGKWVKQMVRDGKGNIWLLSGNHQTQLVTLQRFDPESGAFHSYFEPFPPNGLRRNSVAQLFVDRAGFLWVATGLGLKRYDPYRKLFSDIQQRETFLKDWMLVSTFYEDPNGVLWIGTISQGVLRYAPTTDKFRYYPPPDSDGKNIQWNFMKPFFEDSRGYLWMKTPDGVDRFTFDENDELQKIAHFPIHPIHLWEDSRQRLWIATLEGQKGFDVRTGQFLPLAAIPDLKGRYYIAQEDSEGQLWSVSLGAGVKRYNPSTGKIVHFKDLLANPGILEDGEGNIWFKGANGLKKYDPQTGAFTYYLKDIETVGSTWGEDEIMWVTTSGYGLYRFDTRTGESKRYAPQNGGFPTLRPIAIFKDEHAKLWMSSDVGVIQFDPDTGASQLFDESDGLPGVVFSYGSCQRKNGEFFFPLWEGGFVRFHPDSLRADSIAPRPAIVDFRLFNRPVKVGGKSSPLSQAIWATEHIFLKHDQNNFTLGLTAFHYAAPDHNQFLYKMEGANADWIDPGGQHSVNFAGLSPGRYTFHLKAANHDGVWSEPVALKITILPPWWATWWAYVLYFLLAATAAYAFYFYKKRQWALKSKLAMEEQEAGRLKELDAVKTRLYTNITHEFRTPLTVILGMADQLEAGKDHSDGLAMIKRSGQNLLRLVNQMLDLAKLQAGALPLNMVQADIVAFLKYLLESYHSLAEVKNIELLFLSETEVLMMDFDPEKLREVVSNLLSNAIKFTPEGGQVAVRVDLSNFENLPNLILTVSDTGPGISPDILPHIFDRFYTNDVHAGAGIGLSLTKELVKLLKGDISAKSEPGKGTEFVITLPVSRDAPLGSPPSVEKPAGEQPQTVAVGKRQWPKTVELKDKPHLLIIEDNPDVVVYLTSCLQRDYQLEVARDGKEGLEKARTQVPDLIISDVMMPEMDGFEVCEKLKTDFRTSHIPIVLLTAKGDVSSKITGLQKGADAYLVKPFHREELFVRLQKLLELRERLRERYARPAVESQQLAVIQDQGEEAFYLEDAFMQKIREILEAHLDDEQFDVSGLCKELGMSRSQLYRKFSALTGRSIAQYFRSLRLGKARELLLATNLQISEIAYRVGFKDPAHFSRSFKEEFGMNPSDVRK